MWNIPPNINFWVLMKWNKSVIQFWNDIWVMTTFWVNYSFKRWPAIGSSCMSPRHRYNTKLILTARVYLALRDHLLLSTPEQCLRDERDDMNNKSREPRAHCSSARAWWEWNSTQWITDMKKNPVWVSHSVINTDRLRRVMQRLALMHYCVRNHILYICFEA